MDLIYIAFIEYMLAGKTLLDYTNFFSLNDYKKNDKIIYQYFEEKYVKFHILTEKKKRIKKLSFIGNRTKGFNEWIIYKDLLKNI